jgi:hypothetical protein
LGEGQAFWWKRSCARAQSFGGWRLGEGCRVWGVGSSQEVKQHAGVLSALHAGGKVDAGQGWWHATAAHVAPARVLSGSLNKHLLSNSTIPTDDDEDLADDFYEWEEDSDGKGVPGECFWGWGHGFGVGGGVQDRGGEVLR